MLLARRATFLCGLIAVTALAGCATKPKAALSTGAPAPLTFAATGDGPYGDVDWTLLPEYFAADKAEGKARYLLHAGDLLRGVQTFDDAYSRKVAALYRQSSLPVIFVPGDNEWNDEPNPEQTWALWERDFMHFFESQPGAPTVERQVGHTENIAWLDEDVLFLGINLVGGRIHDVEEWAYRHRANADWVDQNLAKYGAKAYAVVVLAQAAPKAMHEDFFSRFVASVAAFGKPVLYLHGDGHKWIYEPAWRAPNLLRVQVDQVTKARPVHITVDPARPEAPFTFNRHGAENITPEALAMTSIFQSRAVTVGLAEKKYAVYVPQGYTPDQSWPLIYFLHGAGERGDDGLAQTTAGIGPAIVKNPERFPAIVVMPQCPKDSDWSLNLDTLEAVLEATTKEFNIDPKRMYLTGLSMGGYGTWCWGATKTDTFAALLPICGGGDPADIQNLLKVQGNNPYGSRASRVRALATVPIWAFPGGADAVVTPDRSRAMVEAVQAAGGNIQYTEYEGVNHNSWDPAYQDEHTIAWLLKQTKE